MSDKKMIVKEAKDCPLRYSDENGQCCVLIKVRCEEYLNSFPSQCPILGDTVTIESIYKEKG